MNVERTPGWRLYTCDFSIVGRNGSVTLKRFDADIKRWNALSDEDCERVHIWATGTGADFESALADAYMVAASYGEVP